MFNHYHTLLWSLWNDFVFYCFKIFDYNISVFYREIEPWLACKRKIVWMKREKTKSTTAKLSICTKEHLQKSRSLICWMDVKERKHTHTQQKKIITTITRIIWQNKKKKKGKESSIYSLWTAFEMVNCNIISFENYTIQHTCMYRRMSVLYILHALYVHTTVNTLIVAATAAHTSVCNIVCMCAVEWNGEHRIWYCRLNASYRGTKAKCACIVN